MGGVYTLFRVIESSSQVSSCLPWSAAVPSAHPTDPRAVLEGMGFAPDDCRTALARCGARGPVFPPHSVPHRGAHEKKI